VADQSRPFGKGLFRGSLLERPRWLRVARVLWRTFWRTREAGLPEGCPEKFDWPFLKFIWQFDKVTWPRIEAAGASSPGMEAF
jgi:hypothetical protein